CGRPRRVGERVSVWWIDRSITSVYCVPRHIPVCEVPCHIIAVRLVECCVPIYKSIAARDKRVAVERDVTTVPVGSPVIPSPPPSAVDRGTHSRSDAERKKGGRCCIPARISGVRFYWLSING